MSGVACLQNTKFYHNMLTWKCESSTGNIVPRLYLAKNIKRPKNYYKKVAKITMQYINIFLVFKTC